MTESRRLIAFLASAAAAGIHFGAVHSHMREYAPAGLFMLAAGVMQLAWALWVSRGAPSIVTWLGVAANAGIVALWFVSRTAGLPWGPMPGMPEHVHGPDAIATGFEIVIVLAAAGLGTGESPASAPLFRLAGVGALAACLIAAHEPAREQLAVVATLAAAFAGRAVIAHVPAFAVVHIERDRRSHEKVTSSSRFGARRAGDARAGLGASG